MQIKTYVAGPIQANNYLVIDGKEAVLIDCSDYIPELVNYISQNDIKVKYILLTHGHFDHVLGISKMKSILGAKVLSHKEDFDLASNPIAFMQMFGENTSGMENPVIDDVLPSEPLHFGTKDIRVIETPGHTKGCVCYLIDDKLFSGDTLFFRSVGRTDLPGGSFKEIVHSVKDILFALPENTEVFPGHGYSTNIGEEKKFNDIINY